MEEALTARLLAAADLAALVGSRINWTERPQGEALPAVTLQIVGDPRPQHMAGFESFRSTRVRVDCWAASYLGAKAVAEAVIAAATPAARVAGVRFSRASVPLVLDQPETSDAGLIHRRIVDFTFHHATA